MNPPPNQPPAFGAHLPRRLARRRNGHPPASTGRHRAPLPPTGPSGGDRRRPPVWLVAAMGGSAVLVLTWAFVGDLGHRGNSGAPVRAAGAPPQPHQTDPLAVDPAPALTSPGVPIGIFAPTPAAAPGPTGAQYPTPGSGRTPDPPPAGGQTPAPPGTTGSTPQPVLLGPDSDEQLVAMVESYCDRYVNDSWAATHSNGRWECQQAEGQARMVNMNVACRDTYGADAYAQNPGSGSYGWRCYRSA